VEAVPLDDRGLLLGDGLFETLLWSNGALVLGVEHGGRMIRGAGVLGLPPPDLEAFLACAEAAVRDTGLTAERCAVRVTLTAGSGGRGLDRPAAPLPRLFATAAATTRSTEPAKLVISEVRRNAGSPTSRVKSLAYLDNILAREEARRSGADEAVMLNTEGRVACAAVANIFWLEGRILSTPAIEAGCLDGIMRAGTIRAARALGLEVRESFSGPGALIAADAVFLTSSLIGVRPASSLGDTIYGSSRVVEALAAAVAPIC
jgi:branched-subunit amino acid aminotransferase/4-amino-4-deoxychorismate lyase